MDIKSLRYFVAVAEEENLRRASHRLHIAQSALSRQITILEQTVGTKLFIRANGKVRLSEAGQAYLLDTRRILENLREAADRSRRIGRGELGGLRIAATELCITLPKVQNTVEKFLTRNKQLELKLISLSSPAQIELLKRQEIDAGFLLQAPTADLHAPLRVAMLDVQVAMPETHRLAGNAEVSLADLENERFILRAGSNAPFAQRLNGAFLSRRFVPKVACEVQFSYLALDLVRAGVGVLIVPWSGEEPPSPGVVFKTITGLSIPLALDFVMAEPPHSPALVQFVEILAQFCGD